MNRIRVLAAQTGEPCAGKAFSLRQPKPTGLEADLDEGGNSPPGP
jgi:hypothetical protein